MNAKTMFWPRVTYSIEPSFERGRFVEMDWDQQFGRYYAHIQEGLGQRRLRISDEEASHLLEQVRSLKLPAVIEDSSVFDGTSYALSIGAAWTVCYK